LIENGDVSPPRRLKQIFSAPVKPLVWRASLARNQRRIRALRHSLKPGQRLIAIALTEHMGDIVAAEPISRLLRTRHPDARIAWISRKLYAELPRCFPAVDEVLAVTCLMEYWQLAAHHKFDEFYDLHIPGRRCHWFRDAPEPKRAGVQVTTENYFDHGSLLTAFCACANLPSLNDAPNLCLPSAITTAVKRFQLPASYWIIHTTSNVTDKDWPPEKWHALLAQLSAANPSLKFVEVGLEPKLTGGPTPVIDLCGKLNLLELAQVIRQSAGFLGVDSGPAHLANVFERSSVILMGRFHIFARYQPFTGFLAKNADKMLLQWHGPTPEIPVAAVVQKFRAL
jgi:heptosyltransferase-3